MNTNTLHQNGRWHTPFLPGWKPEDGPHPRKRPRALCFEALLALMMLLMLACTAVQDPSGRWEKSGMDPKLEGKWVGVEVEKKENDDKGKHSDTFEPFILAKQKGGYYSIERKTNTDTDAAIRTFSLNEKNFMLQVEIDAAENGFKKAEGKNRSGSLWLYEIEGDTLKFKMLDDKALNRAIKAGTIKGETREEARKKNGSKNKKFDPSLPSIATLDDATCAALAELAQDDKAWKEVSQFKRVKEEEKKAENPAGK